MENSELFKQVEEKLNKHLNAEIESIHSFLDGTKDLIEFSYHDENEGEELCGIYSTKLDRLIYKPEVCSDIKYHNDLNLISLFNWEENIKIWIDLNGKIILTDGEIIQAFAYNCYLIQKNYYSESSSIGTVGISKQELFKPGYDNEEEEDFSGILITEVVEAVADSTERYLMVKIENHLKENMIGIYDIKYYKWVCELKKI